MKSLGRRFTSILVCIFFMLSFVTAAYAQDVQATSGPGATGSASEPSSTVTPGPSVSVSPSPSVSVSPSPSVSVSPSVSISPSTSPSPSASVEPSPVPSKPVNVMDTAGDFYYQLINNNTEVEITGYDGASTVITIPDTIAGKPVTSIGNNAFYNCSSLMNVTIGSKVTSIGDWAFESCSGLTGVTLPNSLINIGTCAFENCDGLTGIAIPNNVTGIGDNAFRSCPGLNSVTIGSKVTSIGDDAFANCTSLGSVTIPKSVATIGDNAFDNCIKMTQIIVDNNNLNYTSQDGVLFNKTKTSLIAYPGGKKGSYTIPGSVLSIGNSAFQDCTELTDVSIGSSVTSIGDHSFANCKGMTGVTIGDNVISIGVEAFDWCINLTSVIIPNKVTGIGEGAFFYCTKLASVTFGSSVASIGSGAFMYCRSLSSVTIPDNVTSIEDSAFYECAGLTSVTIGSGVTSIGDNMFYECTGLSSMSIPDNVTSIGKYAFSGCTGLTNVAMPDRVACIGEYAFYECAKLAKISIPNTVQYIAECTFSGCKGLTGVIIPDSVTGIDYYAFAGCKGLTSVVIPSSVTFIGTGAFEDSGLTYISIPDSLSSIESWTFNGCSKLASIIIPNSVTSIGEYAFYNTGLTSVTIPGRVTHIGNVAFAECSGLTAANFLGNAPTMGQYVFDDCPKVFSVYYYEGKTGFTNPWHGYPTAVISKAIGAVKVSSGSYAVLVADSIAKSKIQGATVNIDGISPAVTDANGSAVFQNAPNNITKKVTVSADGYQTAVLLRDIKTSQSTAVLLRRDTGKPYIKSVFVNNGIDVLSEKTSFRESDTDTGLTDINMTADFKAGGTGTYQLIQDGAVVSQSTTGYFSINMHNGFKPGVTIYVRVVNSQGVQSDAIETGIQIVASTAPADPPATGQIRFGSKTGITVPDGVPIIGGKSIDLGFDDLPFQISVDQDKKVTVSFDSKPIKFSAGAFDADAKITGYGEGVLINGKANIVLKLTISVSGKAGYTQPILIGIVPAYLTVGAEAGADGNVTADLTLDGSDISFTGMDGEITPDVALSGEAGLGISGIISVSGEAKLELDYLMQLSSGHRNLSATGSLSFKAQALMFTYEKTIAQKTWALYDSDNKSSTKSMAAQSADSFNIYDTSQYKLIPRGNQKINTQAQNNKVLSADEDEISVVDSNVYPNAQPRLVQAGDKKYLFWLEDNPARTDENRTMLVYSTWDGSAWSDARAVQDDGTADFNFDVDTDAQGVYVVWQNSKTTFSSGVQLADMAAASEIETARIDNATGTATCTALTDNSQCDQLPAISVQNGQRIVTWLNNSNNDIFGTTGTNSVCYAIYDGGWEPAITLVQSAKPIVSLDAGYMGGKYDIAYGVDEDGDLNTLDDREIYVSAQGAAPVQLTSNSVLDSNPQFSKLNNQDALFWYSDGDIQYTTDLSTVNSVFGGKSNSLTDRFNVMTDGNTTRIIWKALDSAEDNAPESVYAANFDGSNWSGAYKLMDAGNDLSNPNGVIDSSGNNLITFSRTSGDDTQLCTSNVKPQSDISLDSVDFDANAATAGQALPLTLNVTNTGHKTVDSYQVNITRNGSNIYSKTITATAVQAGKTGQFELSDFVVPSDITGPTELKVDVSCADETNMADNEQKIEIGYTDLKLGVTKYLFDGNYQASLNVSNLSSIPTEADLKITANQENGPVIYEKLLTGITNQNTASVLMDIDTLMQQNNAAVVYVSATATAPETSLGDNTETLYMQNQNTCSVQFDTQGGSSIGPAIAVKGGTIAQPQDPTKTGFLFGGWYKEAECQNAWNFQTDTVTGDITLFAKWVQNTDFNSDGSTDLLDLILIAQHYNTNDTTYDLNDDGIVNLFDLMLVAKNIQ